MMVEDKVESPLFRESEVIVARRLSGVRHVADILDSSGEVLAEIRSKPRAMLGCLTIFVAVAAFFRIPVLIGWLTNGLLRLFGSDLESLMDRHIAVAMIVVILIIPSGIVAAMSAAWSLYRPDESSGCRIRLTRPTTPPERCLLLATVILLVIYDF